MFPVAKEYYSTFIIKKIMRYLLFILLVGSVATYSCSTTKQQNSQQETGQLEAKISIKPVIESLDSLQLLFTVYNRTKEPQKFCKWHTPFERTMSKYLDIKNENGIEAAYTGAMAKRIMPPPADSYIEVLPGDSLQIKADIFKDYSIVESGKYTISYNSEQISGLVVKDSVSFIYNK